MGQLEEVKPATFEKLLRITLGRDLSDALVSFTGVSVT